MWWARFTPGCEGIYPDFTCSREWGWQPTDGMFIDQRSIKALMAGCCPTTLTNEILGTVEMPG